MYVPIKFLLTITKLWNIDSIYFCQKNADHPQIAASEYFELDVTASVMEDCNEFKLNGIHPSDNILIVCDACCFCHDPAIWRVSQFTFLLDSSIIDSAKNCSAFRPPLNSNVYTLNATADPQFELGEVYTIKAGNLITQDVGTWNSAEGLLLLSNPSKWERRSNLWGTEIIATILDYYPMCFTLENSSQRTGLMCEIFHIFQNKLNFKVTWTSSSDGLWGGTNKDGAWNGMIGQLVRREVDVAPVGMTLSVKRHQAVSFTLPFVNTKGTIIMYKDHWMSEDFDYLGLVQVFVLKAWLAILMVFLLLASLLWIMIPNVGSMFSAAENMMKIMLQLDYDTFGCNLNFTRRTYFLTASIFGYLIFVSYSSLLTSFMTSRNSFQEMQSLQQVLQVGADVVMWKSSFSEEYFSNAAPGSVKAKIYENTKKKQPSHFALNAQSAYDLLKQNPNSVAFFDMISLMKYHGLVVLDDFNEQVLMSLAMPLQNNSEFVELFNYHWLKLEQSGTVHKLEQKWLGTSRAQQDSSSSEAIQLGFRHLFLPTLILICGIPLSMCIAIIEKLGPNFLHRLSS